MTSPEAQRRDPSARRCQPSSSARPWSSAARIARSGRPAAWCSGGKIRAMDWPRIASAVQPRMCSAPEFQSVTRPSRFVAMMANWVVLSRIARCCRAREAGPSWSAAEAAARARVRSPAASSSRARARRRRSSIPASPMVRSRAVLWDPPAARPRAGRRLCGACGRSRSRQRWARANGSVLREGLVVRKAGVAWPPSAGNLPAAPQSQPNARWPRRLRERPVGADPASTKP